MNLNFLVAVVNTLNTQTHPCKEMAGFCFENAQVKSISYCKQRMKSKLSRSSECDETKVCKPYTSFTSHVRSLCGMVWYRTFRVKQQDASTHLAGLSVLHSLPPRWPSG